MQDLVDLLGQYTRHSLSHVVGQSVQVSRVALREDHRREPGAMRCTTASVPVVYTWPGMGSSTEAAGMLTRPITPQIASAISR